jgi:hypothetical protein
MPGSNLEPQVRYWKNRFAAKHRVWPRPTQRGVFLAPLPPVTDLFEALPPNPNDRLHSTPPLAPGGPEARALGVVRRLPEH